MSKKVMYRPNFSHVPDKIREPEVTNTFKSILVGFYYMFGPIDQDSYNILEDWQKSYWIAIEVGTSPPKSEGEKK